MKRSVEIMDTRDSASSGGRLYNTKRKRSRYTLREHGDQEGYRNNSAKKNGTGKIVANGPVVKTLADNKETDAHRLAQRQKQIDYGKNTVGYDRYCAKVPRHQRRPGEHPMTPDKTMSIGKKVFDKIVRKWRQALHKFDPPELIDAAQIAKANDAEVLVASSITDGEMERGFATKLKETTDQVPTNSLSRSIYDNFDEDISGEENDSDDSLL
ncbi:Histone mRNA stem-loop binding protein [Plasmopara halstedii]|uniref:Histone mRNA stem-loop binding protein n=1 Tax=Plasmopara halstedii TaxID=4781 RepID=A0A0P1AVN8_PLAHL|nr:Histone mRNA stem-loop binding protein [Plasmopara halstedii]CEG45559.1 Histone mRNA stem-loop binding protein [Plasmopara halstedii]|eukprot:XP_024581928.1 Histone mRNA stem-loop binding protein [Plasmopara halstedii]